MSTTRINKAHHQNHDNSTMAESSATESVNRGPRRTRKSSQSNNGSNNMSDYGSPRAPNKSISGTFMDHVQTTDVNAPMTRRPRSFGGFDSNQKLCSTGKRSSRRYKEPVHEWAQGDTDDFRDEDFDFQHNLGLFDKAAVFAEIRVCLTPLACIYCLHTGTYSHHLRSG